MESYRKPRNIIRKGKQSFQEPLGEIGKKKKNQQGLGKTKKDHKTPVLP